MNEYNDEISLRDLYLILRRGLPLIALLTVIAAAAAFVVISLQPSSFEASATVLVTPTPVRTQDAAGVSFIQRTDVPFETYEALAYSRPVLQAVIDQAGLAETDAASLRKRVSVTRLVGPQRADQPAQLIISHTVTSTDAAGAAQLTNLWAEQTINSVQDTMLAILAPARNGAGQELAELGGELTALELAWEEFQGRDNRTLLEAQLASLAKRSAESRESLDKVDRDLAAAQARQSALAEALGQQDPARADGVVDSRSTLALLSSRGLLSPEASAELTAFLQGAAGDRQLIGLLLGLELQQQTGDIAALLAERDATTEQLAGYEGQAQVLRTRISELARTRTELERDLRLLSARYEEALSLVPTLDYVHRMIPSNSGVLDAAVTPGEPLPSRRLLVTVIAALVAGLLALVFVFLREAVRPEPAAAAPFIKGEPVSS
jgi:uncharacterized protein involved in exopolysaccharide biosynthesis